MKVIELYERSIKFGIESEDVNEALAFVSLHDENNGRKKALCGYCANRLSDACPWPEKCRLTYPACNEFAKKGGKE